MTRVLEIILTEILIRLHVEGLRVYIHDKVNCVIVKLSSRMCCQKLMSLREPHIAHEGILKLADYGVDFVVGHCRTKAYCSVFKSYSEDKVHLELLSSVDEVLVSDGDHIIFLRHCRDVLCAVNLHLLLFVGIVEDSPESCT